MSFIDGLLLGIIAGLLANHIFDIIRKLIQTRLKVEIGRPSNKIWSKENVWIVPVRFYSPRLKRVFSTPRQEEFSADLVLDTNISVLGEWFIGQVYNYTYRATGQDVAPLLLLTVNQTNIYFSDDICIKIKEGKHCISLKVCYLWDGNIAAEQSLDFEVSKNRIIWSL